MGEGSKKPLAAIAILALALLIPIAASCGEDDNNDDSGSSAAAERIENFGADASGTEAGKLVERRLKTYLEARSAGEWKKACSYLTSSSRQLLARAAKGSERIEGEGCAAALADATKRLPPSGRAGLGEVKVESVRLEGDRGYVLYEGAEGTKFAAPSMREDGRWGVAFSAFPLQ